MKLLIATLLCATIVCSQAQKLPVDNRTCEEKCAATTCMQVQNNCTINGGSIKRQRPMRQGDCACCDVCVFTGVRRDLCGTTFDAIYECGCNLICLNGQCQPIKGKPDKHDHKKSSESSCSD